MCLARLLTHINIGVDEINQVLVIVLLVARSIRQIGEPARVSVLFAVAVVVIILVLVVDIERWLGEETELLFANTLLDERRRRCYQLAGVQVLFFESHAVYVLVIVVVDYNFTCPRR